MIELAPSILNSNLACLGDEVGKIREADWLHFDVMDGHFVPNLTFGPMFVSALKKVSNLPVESHLMVKNPEFFVPLYAEAGSKRITVHAESSNHLHRLVQQIKKYGCQAGIALNPATPINCLEYILPDIDLVLLMTVNPGYGGQELISGVIPKVKKLRELIELQNVNCSIEVDGGVNWDNVKLLVEAGANVIVAGTLIFNAPDPEAAVKRLKSLST
jgi:ribulose-phosphate 3-epimerase